MRLLLANVVLAALMTGVIWLVQLVVYPMFLDAGPDAFPAWETDHSIRITPLVAPLIALELGVALAVVVQHPGWLARANLGFALLAIALTGLVSVPLHAELADGWDAGTIDALVQTNWLRTAAWSAQLAAAAALLARMAPRAGARDEGRPVADPVL